MSINPRPVDSGSADTLRMPEPHARLGPGYDGTSTAYGNSTAPRHGGSPDLHGVADISDAPRHRAAHSWEGRLLLRLLHQLGDPPIEFHFLWSGERVAPPTQQPMKRVRIADRGTLFGMLRDPQVKF